MKASKWMLALVLLPAMVWAQSRPTLLNEPLDISPDFRDHSNYYFFADSLTSFDPKTGKGTVKYLRHEAMGGHAFSNTQFSWRKVGNNEFPATEYAEDPVLPFSLEFVSDRTVRIKMETGTKGNYNEPSLMLVKEPVTLNNWAYNYSGGKHTYKSAHGSVVLSTTPWKIEFFDALGNLITQTRHQVDGRPSYKPTMPFGFIRRKFDYSRSLNAAFALSPDEKIFGCGESFVNFDKVGDKVVLCTTDANGVESQEMYKPIPFYLSNKGYGMFMHTSTPITCDFGNTNRAVNALMIGDESLDLFVFLGQPKDILDEYTNLTGKAPMPPLWSFGLWMSRITYFSEKDGRDIVTKLREHKIPADVIHFDTGWFETDWRCDYEFSKNRFTDPVKMIADFKKVGIQTCLWQLPYFVPKNVLFNEIIKKGLNVKNATGGIPYEDAVLDFTNPETIAWYRDKIGGLLKLGVSAIKVDFGETAPLYGIYSNGRTGFYEHNLYPLRYNKIVSDLTQEINNERIIWARSTWAGSQRYPLHWGGDAESTDMGMAAELRGGLSLGVSGFTFWSHDIGGFTQRTNEELYRRWLPMGIFASHSRCHGQPPKEPWDYGKDFEDYFRNVTDTKYRLMPYIYTQAKLSSMKGLPMTRALLVEFPDDRGAWNVDNQYMFGADMMIAPIFETGKSEREVYLPKGKWVDFQSGSKYEGGQYLKLKTGAIQAIILVRDGAVIPQTEQVVQHTGEIDWSKITLVKYGSAQISGKLPLFLPGNTDFINIGLIQKGNKFNVTIDSASTKLTLSVKNF